MQSDSEEYELRDRMVRKPCGSFVLMRAGKLPSDPEVEEPHSLEGWLKGQTDCHKKIERTVMVSGFVSRLRRA
jgi:hypothetical protein